MQELEDNRDILQNEVDTKAEIIADLQGAISMFAILTHFGSQDEEMEV